MCGWSDSKSFLSEFNKTLRSLWNDQHLQDPVSTVTLLLTVDVFKSRGECAVSSCLFIEERGDAVEVFLAQFGKQLLSRCMQMT